MYEEFFGLNEKPFSIQPDPSFLYWGRSHRLAYAMLEYGVLNHAGISVVTGEVGCGKTTLIHRLLDQLSDTHTVALLSNIQPGRGDLLSWVLMGYGQSFAGKSHVEMFAELQNFFIDEYSKGRRVVLIIDEAQNLSVDMLEELRMLSNINAGKDQLLQLILVGQPELKSLLNRPDMLQLAQRVGSDFHLTPLNREEVDAYLDTRLSIAGCARRVFKPDAVDLIAIESQGVPRVINIIADTALVYAFSANEEMVNMETISAVIRDKSDYGVFGVAVDSNVAPAHPSGAFQARRPDIDKVMENGAAPLKADASSAKTKSKKTTRKKTNGAAPPLSDKPAPGETAPEAAADQTPTALLKAAERIEASNLSATPTNAYPSKHPAPPPAAIETPGLHSDDHGFSAPLFAKTAEPDNSAHGNSVSPVRETHKKNDIAQKAPPLLPNPSIQPASPASSSEPSSAASASMAQLGVIMLDKGNEISPEAAMRALGDIKSVIYVTATPESEAAMTAQRLGADIVKLPSAHTNAGRARNTGYRRLKALNPDAQFVQFLEPSFVLHADWLRKSLAFMKRRPEVAVIDGASRQRYSEKSLFNLVNEISRRKPDGETQITGATALIRAEAFEAAGGFRGDISVNDTDDLCLRMRRRGHHVWRLEADMGIENTRRLTIKDWWRAAQRTGYEYAHGVFLHGAPPERFRVLEQARALIWGGAFPFFVVIAAIVSAVSVKIMAPMINPVSVLLWIISFGLLVYFVKILLIALREGIGDKSSWAYGVMIVLGHFGEFLGVVKYYLEPRSEKPDVQ